MFQVDYNIDAGNNRQTLVDFPLVLVQTNLGSIFDSRLLLCYPE